MSFDVKLLTLFPEMFPSTLGHSLAGKALADDKWRYEAVDIRKFAKDKHRTVDDHPAGGGAGMVIKPDILAAAIDATPHKGPRLLMSPRGKPFSQLQARALAAGEGVMIICGRFEGIDERVIETRGLEEVSVGDYILSGGEPAAVIVLDAIIRLLPGVMGHAESHAVESFEDGLLEHPHYTKPRIFEGLDTPEILSTGNHALIEKWKLEQRLKLTQERRPDLYEKYIAAKG